MAERVATCCCGNLRAVCQGDPVRISVCHCFECKRRTGSVFGYNATFPAEQVETSGPFRTYERDSEDGFWVRNHFCPDCGAVVFYEIERRPGMISVPIGAFADPEFPEPTFSVYGELAHPWLQIRTSVPVREE